MRQNLLKKTGRKTRTSRKTKVKNLPLGQKKRRERKNIRRKKGKIKQHETR